MKSFLRISIITLIMALAMPNLYSQWVDFGKYSKLSTGKIDASIISNDKQKIYYLSYNKLKKIHLPTGTISTLLDTFPIAVTDAERFNFAISEDERYLYFQNKYYFVQYDLVNKFAKDSNELFATIPFGGDGREERNSSSCGINCLGDKLGVKFRYNRSTPYYSYSGTRTITFKAEPFAIFDSSDYVPAYNSYRTRNNGTFGEFYGSSGSTTKYGGGNYGVNSDYYFGYMDILDKSKSKYIVYSSSTYSNDYSSDFEVKPGFYPSDFRYYDEGAKVISSDSNIYTLNFDTELFTDSLKLKHIVYEFDNKYRYMLDYSNPKSLKLFDYIENGNVEIVETDIKSIDFVAALEEDFKYYIFTQDSTLYKIDFMKNYQFDAKIVCSKSYEQVDVPIEFTAISLASGLTYNWKFSDGATYTGVKIQRAFSTAGYYGVELTISDGVTSKVVQKDSIVWIKSKVKADFSISFENKERNIVRIHNNSQGDIKEYKWELGNGRVSYEKDPGIVDLKIYGFYSFKLTVKDSLVSDSYIARNILEDEEFIYDTLRILDTFHIPNNNLSPQCHSYFDSDNLLVYDNVSHLILKYNISNKKIDTLIKVPGLLAMVKNYNNIFLFDTNNLYLYKDTGAVFIRKVSDNRLLNQPRIYKDMFYAVYGSEIKLFNQSDEITIPVTIRDTASKPYDAIIDQYGNIFSYLQYPISYKTKDLINFSHIDDGKIAIDSIPNTKIFNQGPHFALKSGMVYNFGFSFNYQSPYPNHYANVLCVNYSNDSSKFYIKEKEYTRIIELFLLNDDVLIFPAEHPVRLYDAQFKVKQVITLDRNYDLAYMLERSILVRKKYTNNGFYFVRFAPLEVKNEKPVGRIRYTEPISDDDDEEIPLFELTKIQNVYPNPAEEEVVVNFTAIYKSNYEIEIYDAMGSLVKVAEKGIYYNIKDIPIFIGDLNIGTYFIKVTSGGKSDVKLFVKTK